MSSNLSLKQVTFARLRPLCCDLLRSEDNDKDTVRQLDRLAQALEQFEAEALLTCWDYLTFPMLMLLDRCSKALPRKFLANLYPIFRNCKMQSLRRT